MRSVVHIISLLISLSIALFAVSAGAAQEIDERIKLMEQQKLLSNRIEKLKREQDFLFFQKTLYASDSKYLILSISAKKGQLKYKNRVLKDFRFLSASSRTRGLKQEKITLTKKIEGIQGRNALIFDKTLILAGKNALAIKQGTNIPRIILKKKDFIPIFYSLEQGAAAYIIP